MADLRDRDRARHRYDRKHRPFLCLRLRIASCIWSLIMPVIACQSNLARLLAWAGPAKNQPYRGLAAETIWRCCHRTVKRPFFMRDRPCLREGLLLYRFLVMGGYQPSLHFGIDKDSVRDQKIKAHCWVKLGNRIFNPPTPSMIEIHSHADHDSSSHVSEELRVRRS